MNLTWTSVADDAPPEFKAVLTKHIDDLFPVVAFRLDDGTWLREVEGPEDVPTRDGANEPLYRDPTHWMPLDVLPGIPRAPRRSTPPVPSNGWNF